VVVKESEFYGVMLNIYGVMMLNIAVALTSDGSV
jgi:hypothetical protein